jgi:hypothetical protein
MKSDAELLADAEANARAACEAVGRPYVSRSEQHRAQIEEDRRQAELFLILLEATPWGNA